MENKAKKPLELYVHIPFCVKKCDYCDFLSGPAGKERQAEYFLEQGVRNVIITLGHRGCYLRTPEQAFWYDAPPVATVDATGAADAFIAALAVYLLQNYSLEDAVEIASHAAGFCVTKQGVIPALVDRNSLDQYLATRPRPLRCSPSPLPASHKRR